MKGLRTFVSLFFFGLLLQLAAPAFASMQAATDGQLPPLDMRHSMAGPVVSLGYHPLTHNKLSRSTAAFSALSSAAALSEHQNADSGEQPLLVVRVGFRNQAAVYSQTELSQLFFGEQNSVTSYYHDNSAGQLNIVPAQPDSVIDVTLDYDHPDFGSAINGGTSYTLAQDALLAAFEQGLVDIARFDSNGDGYLTAAELGIVFVIAGYENAYAGAAASHPRIWAHQSRFNSLYLDDVLLNGYVMVGEQHEDHLATMGVICHELGHLLLGLPDLYDAAGSATGVGRWGLMGLGGWNSDQQAGDSPADLLAWSRHRAGFSEPEDLPSGVSGWNLQTLADNQSSLEVSLDEYQHGERVLFEFREASSLGSASVLITHVNDQQQLLSATGDKSADGISLVLDDLAVDDYGVADQAIYDLDGGSLVAVVAVDSERQLRIESFLEPTGRSFGYFQQLAEASWHPAYGEDLVVVFPADQLAGLDTFDGIDVFITTAGMLTIDLQTGNVSSRFSEQLDAGWNRILFGEHMVATATDSLTLTLIASDSSATVGLDLSDSASGQVTTQMNDGGLVSSDYDVNLKVLYSVAQVAPANTQQTDGNETNATSSTSDSGSSGGGAGGLLWLIATALLVVGRRSTVPQVS